MIITITGKLAAGKTTLSRHYEKKGAKVVCADKLGKQILERPEIKRKLAEAFGTEIITSSGTVSREKLAEKAFQNRQNLEKLNATVHPLLKEEIKKAVRDHKGIVIVDAALVTELGLDEISDVVIVVKSSDDAAAARMPAEKRQNLLRRRTYQTEPKGDFQIENNGTLQDFLTKADKLWNEIMQNGKNKQDSNLSGKL